jgi:hypothetical protein
MSYREEMGATDPGTFLQIEDFAVRRPRPAPWPAQESVILEILGVWFYPIKSIRADSFGMIDKSSPLFFSRRDFLLNFKIT